ncbi:MAG: XdhC family protein [Gammaproteobacteria bacterium]|nr:XdhC family protein [Gammaproteobacteria bacterium]
MRNMIYQKISELISNNTQSWLVTVVGASGSSPGKIGMKMLVINSGETIGTIGGGAIELRVTQKILTDKPTLPVRFSFDLGGNFASEKTGMLCGGEQEVFVDPLFVGHDLYIFGGGHCGQALSELAAKCNFRVTVFDDRPDVVTKTLHPFASKLICVPYADICQHINFSADNTFLVVMTYSHKHDEVVMRQLISQSYKYLGIIGSKNKVQTIFEHLVKDGFSEELLAKLYTPIGLNIGSQTPYEIAISVMAQLIAVKNAKTGLKLNSNPYIDNN